MDVKTPFTLVYDSFFAKITDDMYLEMTELDTCRMLSELLMTAIEKFEFPRVDIFDYELMEVADQVIYNGAETDYVDALAFVYEGGYFNHYLTYEEINIIAIYMVVEWLSQQLASIENTRMKYSGDDFKFTSQANHMSKILQMKKDYEREGFHMQRLYKRRRKDQNGIMRSTFGQIMQPVDYNEEFDKRNLLDYNNLRNKPSIESVVLVDDRVMPEFGWSEITAQELDDIISGGG